MAIQLLWPGFASRRRARFENRVRGAQVHFPRKLSLQLIECLTMHRQAAQRNDATSLAESLRTWYLHLPPKTLD